MACSASIRSPMRLALCAAALTATAACADTPEEPRPAWAAPRPVIDLPLRVIELPADTPLPRARKHHALTWHNEALSRALGNSGLLSGAECSNRVRLPARLRSVPGGAPAPEVQLQFAVGCSF